MTIEGSKANCNWKSLVLIIIILLIIKKNKQIQHPSLINNMIYCHKNLIIIIRCIVCTCQTTRLNIKSFQTFPGNKIQTTSVSNLWINLIVAFMFVTSVFYSYSWLEWKTHMYIKMSILSLPPLKNLIPFAFY